jgi:cytochrome P450
VAHLLSHPEQWQALRANPDLAANAVEETFRWDSPLQAMPRTTTEAVEIAGQRLPKGAVLLLMFGSANRDEVHGVQPDGFDIRRRPIDHLGLGRGIHYCMGAQLARLEARIALETLTQDLRNLRLQPGQPLVYVPNLLWRGLQSLPVEWDVA